MSKFKVGDVVQRKSHRSDITKYLGCGNNGAYTVTDVHSLGSWIQLDGWDDAGKDRYPWYFNNFVLAESDELPPAPEGVQYIELTGSGSPLATLHAFQHPLGDGIIVHTQGVIKITPDEALQLCHDLRRMAMEIKRKGKQDN